VAFPTNTQFVQHELGKLCAEGCACGEQGAAGREARGWRHCSSHGRMEEKVKEQARRAREAVEKEAKRAGEEARRLQSHAAAETRKRWRTLKQTVGFAAALQQRPADGAPEEEGPGGGLPGAVPGLLRDICEAAGFAFAEVWTRPSKEVRSEAGMQVQWDHMLKFSDVTYANHAALPEARTAPGRLDEFKRVSRDASYAKASSIPGLAWSRGALDWRDLSVYDVLDETIQADERVMRHAMDLFDASIAIPVRHPVYKKTCAIIVFYRSRHVASPTAVCYAPEYHKHPAVVEVFTSAQRLAPLAVEYDMSMLHWHSVREEFRKENALAAAHSKDAAVGRLARDGLGEANPKLLKNLRTQAATAVSALKEREEFKRLSAMEAEWEKGKFAGWLKTYTNKWKGTGGMPAKGTDWTYCKWVFVGSLAAIGAMSFIDDMIDEYTFGGGYTLYAIVTHFSAVALILFSTPTSPFGQPRNVVGGHILSAVSMCVHMCQYVCTHACDGAGRGAGRNEGRRRQPC